MTQTFFVEPKKVVLRDKEISVSPIKVKNISKATLALSPLIGALSKEVNLALVLENSDSIITLCAIASEQPEEWLGELNAGELLSLLSVVVDTNINFFSQAIMPQIQAMVSKVGQIAKESQTVGTAT